jgi:hypothetical protein
LPFTFAAPVLLGLAEAADLEAAEADEAADADATDAEERMELRIEDAAAGPPVFEIGFSCAVVNATKSEITRYFAETMVAYVLTEIGVDGRFRSL